MIEGSPPPSLRIRSMSLSPNTPAPSPNADTRPTPIWHQWVSVEIFQPDYLRMCGAVFLFFCGYHLLTPIIPALVQQRFPGLDVGLAVSLFMAASILTRPWAGKAADEHNRVRLLWIAALTFTLCSLSYGWITHPALLLSIRLIHGMAFAMFVTTANSYLIRLLPVCHKAEGLSYYSNAIKLAMAFAPGAGMLFIASVLPSWPFWTSALLGGVTLLLVTGLTPLGHDPTQKKKGKLWNAKAVGPGLLLASNSLVFGALIPYIPLLAEEKGLESAAWFYPVYAVALMSSRAGTGKASDTFGRLSVLAPSMAAVTLAVLAIAWADGITLFLLASAAYGFAAGSVQPSLMAMAADRITEAPDGTRDDGSMMATFTLLTDLGLAVGMAAMGSIGTQPHWAEVLPSGLAQSGFSTATDLVLMGVAVITAIGLGGLFFVKQVPSTGQVHRP